MEYFFQQNRFEERIGLLLLLFLFTFLQAAYTVTGITMENLLIVINAIHLSVPSIGIGPSDTHINANIWGLNSHF